MRILYVRPNTAERDVVVAALVGHEVIFTDNLSEVADDVLSSVEVLSVFVDTVVDVQILERCPKLRCIATRSVGFDHIDVARAHERNIIISRVPHYGSQTVAEFAFALMFELSRKVGQAHTDMLMHGHVANLEPYEGFDLGGKTLGVVGTGMIGQRVCAIAKSFGMEVVAFDVYPNDVVKNLGVTYASLEELMRVSDIVTLHVPGGPQTHHLIDASVLGCMKPTAYLINTARGEVIDTNALVRALKDNKLAGAGLDVLEGEHALVENKEHVTTENENLIALDRELIAMQNVVVTPHIGFNTKEAKKEITACTIANIQAYSKGDPINIVS